MSFNYYLIKSQETLVNIG